MSKISGTFTIKAIIDKHPLFVIHPKKAIEIDLARKKLACICFGNRKHYVRIKLDEEIDQENVMLSKELIDELHLPDYPIYEIRVKENKIIIGPYIGLLISKADEDLTNSRLRKMMTYVKEYSRLHGAVVVFALNKVDTRNRLIEGYCYNPVKNYWQRGTFPYPSSIYRTIGLSKEWKNHFLSVIGDRIFNNQYFGKWKMYQWFSENTEIYPHIPYTTLYQSYHDVFDLLEKYKKLYIKPVLGLKGHRIVQVSMEEKNVFVFKYREQGINYEVTLENRRETKEFIQKRFNDGKFVLQQAVELLEYQDGIVDFRCVMQKNQSNMWVCKAIVGRKGEQDSVVSNISSGGKAFRLVEILEKVTPFTKENINVLTEKIESLAVDICNAVDEYGINCGTLGIDIGIDKKGCLWLIEINNRNPGLSIALDIHDKQLYYTLKTGQLFYAKSLAGFKPD